jgi:steroid 5-alpha reductase family enzyme
MAEWFQVLVTETPAGAGLAAFWLLLAIAWTWGALARRQPKGAGLSLSDIFPWLPLLLLGLYWLLPATAGSARQWLADYLAMGAAIWGLLTLVWFVSLAKRDCSIMDIAYPLVPMAGCYFVWWSQGQDLSSHSLLVLALGSIWALRLSLYLAGRYLPHGEEARYAKWRQRGGPSWWWWSYFQIFLTQGVICWLWSMTLFFAIRNQGALAPLDWLALALWLVGFIFEAGGDLQLSRFRSDPANKGRVMQHGLWSLTRHPNYFGEALTWLSYLLLALGTPWGWLAAPSVAMVFWFMNQGSATRMTERYMMKTKPGYAEYMARTPAFWPRWPDAPR